MKNCKGCGVSKLAWLLVIIGALNWGIVGVGYFFSAGWSWNVVNMLLGQWGAVEAVVYLLVGISGIALLFGCKCKTCMATEQSMPM